MGGLGLVGAQKIELQEAVGTSGRAIRVFDVCLATTAIINASCDLYAGTNTSGTLYVSVQSSDPHFHSHVGIRFPNGCFARSTGTTATVTYIEEF